jgi:prepilin-type N-terminal cleavage/methylation domain-containing protein
MRPLQREGHGFTLIELMIVVAIIGLLAGIAIPKFADLVRKSNEATTRGSLGSLRSALVIYYSDSEGGSPQDHLECLYSAGKYLSEIPKSYLPPHHGSAALVSNNDEYAGVALYSADAGHWVYASDPAITPLEPRNFGDIWVGCNHLDSRGIVWSSQ